MILFSVAFSMTRGANQRRKLLKEEVADAEQREDIAIVPLAIPLLAGPGSIGTVILLMSQHQGVLASIVVIVCILLVATVTYIIFSNARYLLRILGASGVRVMTRLFGLLLAAISVQFIINGITTALPSISKGIAL